MNEILKDCDGQDIIPLNMDIKLTLKTNSHTNTDGSSWGWVEGCTKNICWSNDNYRFDKEAAKRLVEKHNSRLAT